MLNIEEGKLYVVPTPIGHLRDITIPALDALKDVDIIAAEDTRQTLKLLNHFNIRKTLISYHKFNEEDKSINIINSLKEGKNIALVSDAGMPGISDPGYVLIKKCIEEQIIFEVLPGATAFTTALVYSGMDTTKFIFKGFIPRENKNRQKLVQDIKDRMETLIFYESPHRVKSTLENMLEVYGDRQVVLVRELTKIYEEYQRGLISELLEAIGDEPLKGECLLIVDGASEEKAEKSEEELLAEIDFLIETGSQKSKAIKEVAKKYGLNKSDLYSTYHQ